MTNFTKTRLTDKGLALLAKTGVSVTVTKVKTGNGEYQSGYLNVRASEQKYMKNVEDVKLEMKIGKKKVFKKELSSREWKDLKNHGQIGYSYEYKNTGKLYDDYTDGKIIIKIKYYNKELKKNVEIWINPWEGIESREKILLKD